MTWLEIAAVAFAILVPLLNWFSDRYLDRKPPFLPPYDLLANRNTLAWKLQMSAITIGLTVYAIATFWSAILAIRFAVSLALTAFGGNGSSLAITAIGVFVGIILFFLRTHRQAAYGVLEVFLSIGALSYSADQLSMGEDRLVGGTIGFIGAVYFFVRGATNVNEGRKAKRGWLVEFGLLHPPEVVDTPQDTKHGAA